MNMQTDINIPSEDFEDFGKIPRLNRMMTVTEKY